ncbi:hypothetical protein CDD83_50 [Cordyceps sp. RAO-2017]|nr:hypothetical protein CDD83_50 [Cordyceps sp. RAO-2017]
MTMRGASQIIIFYGRSGGCCLRLRADDRSSTPLLFDVPAQGRQRGWLQGGRQRRQDAKRRAAASILDGPRGGASQGLAPREAKDARDETAAGQRTLTMAAARNSRPWRQGGAVQAGGGGSGSAHAEASRCPPRWRASPASPPFSTWLCPTSHSSTWAEEETTKWMASPRPRLALISRPPARLALRHVLRYMYRLPAGREQSACDWATFHPAGWGRGLRRRL